MADKTEAFPDGCTRVLANGSWTVLDPENFKS